MTREKIQKDGRIVGAGASSTRMVRVNQQFHGKEVRNISPSVLIHTKRMHEICRFTTLSLFGTTLLFFSNRRSLDASEMDENTRSFSFRISDFGAFFRIPEDGILVSNTHDTFILSSFSCFSFFHSKSKSSKNRS